MHPVSEDAVPAGDHAVWAHLLPGLLPQGGGPQQQVPYVPHRKPHTPAATMLLADLVLVL